MKMLIGGQKVDSGDGKKIEVYCPANGELIDTVPKASAEDIEKAIAFAQAGKVEWAQTPLHQRCTILRKFADLIAENKEALSVLLCQETGKSMKDARAEMGRIDIMARGFVERANHLYGHVLCDAQPGMEHDYCIAKRVPLGVVVCVTPYNYPISLYTQKVLPALVMGNAVLIKPASDTPLTTIRVTELLLEAGVPGNAAQIISGKGSDVGNYIVSSPKIDAVTLTGSTEVGIRVAETAAKHLHHVFLELGGNDALVLLEDADLEQAVAEAVASRASNAGQTCGASKRFIVHNQIKDRFAKMLVEKLKQIRVGDIFDQNTDVGCLINEKAAVEVERQVQHTVEQGAKCILGGERFNKTFFPMTVLVEVTPHMDITKDMEVFGPVFPIIGFDTDDEAVAIANASMFGLSGGVMSKGYMRAIKIAERMESGGVVVNGSGNYRPPELAFGGFKMSGLGREGISATLEEMSQGKNIVLKGFR